MPATVIPINQSQATLIPQKNWGFSQASYTFQATKLVDSDRYRELERRASYYKCTNHDHKRYDFDGRNIRPGPYNLQQPLMGNNAAPFYVPLSQRRPCAPLRLGKQIVNSFTKIVFGEDRWPDIICKEDTRTAEFAHALVEASHLDIRMISGRNKGGSQGTSGLSWYFHNGVPHVEVHDIKTLHVHEWASKERWKPNHVTKCYKHVRSVWDPEHGAVVQKEFWYRRDWTTLADIFYLEVEAKDNAEPVWVIDENRSSIHNDGFCHFVWWQNVPCDDQDGEPDYDGVYEKLDELDIINSVVCRGGKLNLDPTLVLNLELEAVGSTMVKKGSDNALVVGQSGGAKYLEISGQSLEAGGKLVDRLKQQVLDETECVVTDPDKVAAGSVSSVALQMVYAPMLARRNLLCSTAGDAIIEILQQMIKVARAKWKEIVQVPDADGNVVDTEVTNYLTLPPKVIEEDVVDEEGNPTGEVEIRFEEREPGVGTRLELQWGPPFKPNSVDIQNTVTSMNLATSGKAVLSQKSAVEILANMIGKDPKQIMEELEGDHKKQLAMNDTMFGMPGGADTLKQGEEPEPTTEQVPDTNSELDPETEYQRGFKEESEEHGLDETTTKKLVLDHLEKDPAYYRKDASPQDSSGSDVEAIAPEAEKTIPKISLTSTDLGAIIKVNEARAQYGLGPWHDADGLLTLAEFKVKHSATVSGSAMTDKGEDPNEPKPEPKPFGSKVPFAPNPKVPFPPKEA